MADYYELLRVSRDAGPDEIKRAYRKVAMRHHPDRNDGSKEAERRFKEVTEAYEVLRDPAKRARYDRFGKAGLGGGAAAGGGFGIDDALEVFMRNFGGFGMGGPFGGRRPRDGPARGRSLRLTLPLTLEDVRAGVRKRVRVAVLDECGACKGSGARGGDRPRTCPACGGAGEERRVERSVFGRFVSVARCGRCGGEGSVIADPCSECRGEGRVRARRELAVNVPPGVTSEHYITLRGEGNVGPRGGARGDVVVLLNVREDPRFERDGPNLTVEVPVTFATAALGGSVRAPTVEGETRVDVPAGVQSGEVIRVRGEGVPELDGRQRGDLFVRVAVWVPDRLNAEQERLLKALREVEDEAPRAIDPERRRGFWSRVREALG